jgi:hypothetical protein
MDKVQKYNSFKFSKVYHRLHESQPLGPIRGQLNPVHPLAAYFNIILLSTSRSPKLSLPLMYFS